MIATDTEREDFRRHLLAWYDENKREMPWRGADDPYHILLSEFMLQQTQVRTVIPYFERFVRDFPTVEDLAAADLDDVLKRWEGLGYYTRARNLHKAAKALAEDHGGQVPEEIDRLLDLPGFGPYTAAAVASIAFDRPHAVLDGNVIRVLSRLHGITLDVSLGSTRKQLQSIADELLDPSRPGDYNQAVMELGATVCRPRQPDCATCPVQSQCNAYHDDLVDSIPRKARKAQRPERSYGALIINKGDRILISRRKPEGLLGGLWEFPSVETAEEPTADTVRELLPESYALEVADLRPFRRVTHAYSHFTARVQGYTCDWTSGEPASEEHDRHEWVGMDDIGDYAYSRIARKLVDALQPAEDDQMIIDLENRKEKSG